MDPLLSPYESSETDLIKLLRSELRDDDYTISAFTLAVRDDRARSATAEVRNGQLRITLVGGSLGSQTIDLAGIETDTLGGLVDHLKLLNGYCISANDEMCVDHPATDLRIKGNGSLSKSGTHFFHRRWDDKELRGFLDRASKRHNMNYAVDKVPMNEYDFVVTLAVAAAHKVMATEGVKRRGLSFDVDQCLAISRDYEDQYREDRNRQNRAVPVAKIKDSNIEGGDIVQGQFVRRNLRTGYMTPISSAESPEVPELYVSGEEDVQDIQVRVSWRRIKDVDFYAMELWRDTRPDVKRSHLGNVLVGTQSPSNRIVFPTTAKLVFAPRWLNSQYTHSALTHHGVSSGQIVNNFVDGLQNQQSNFVGGAYDAPPPEPETIYFYKLFVFNINRQVVGSDTIEVRTKRIRARFDPLESNPTPLSPQTGPIAGGTACTIIGTKFHTGMRVHLGDKEVLNLIIVNPTEATFDSPEVFNERIVDLALDVVITSDTGLEDAVLQVWRYTLV